MIVTRLNRQPEPRRPKPLFHMKGNIKLPHFPSKSVPFSRICGSQKKVFEPSLFCFDLFIKGVCRGAFAQLHFVPRYRSIYGILN